MEPTRSPAPWLVVLAAVAFVSLGLPDGLLGVAWPAIRGSFGRRLDALGLLLLAGTAGYVASSFSSGWLLRHLRLGPLLAASTALTAAGVIGFATAPAWWALLPLATVLGLGAGAIDAALNTATAVAYGPRTLNLLHACYGVGAALGPLIMTRVLAAAAPWQRGYALVAAAQATLAVAFVLTRRHWPAPAPTADSSVHTSLWASWRVPAARLNVLTFVTYAGVEATLGAWTFSWLTLGRGVPPGHAGTTVSAFWFGLTAGRVLAATVGGRLEAVPLLRGAILVVIAATVIIRADFGFVVTLAAVIVAGLACGPIFPLLVALTPARVGAAHAANAVGFQIAAAAVGLSAIPALVGLAAQRAGLEIIGTLVVLLAVLLAIVNERMPPAQT